MMMGHIHKPSACLFELQENLTYSHQSRQKPGTTPSSSHECSAEQPAKSGLDSSIQVASSSFAQKQPSVRKKSMPNSKGLPSISHVNLASNLPPNSPPGPPLSLLPSLLPNLPPLTPGISHSVLHKPPHMSRST